MARLRTCGHGLCLKALVIFFCIWAFSGTLAALAEAELGILSFGNSGLSYLAPDWPQTYSLSPGMGGSECLHFVSTTDGALFFFIKALDHRDLPDFSQDLWVKLRRENLRRSVEVKFLDGSPMEMAGVHGHLQKMEIQEGFESYRVLHWWGVSGAQGVDLECKGRSGAIDWETLQARAVKLMQGIRFDVPAQTPPQDDRRSFHHSAKNGHGLFLDFRWKAWSGFKDSYPGADMGVAFQPWCHMAILETNLHGLTPDPSAIHEVMERILHDDKARESAIQEEGKEEGHAWSRAVKEESWGGMEGYGVYETHLFGDRCFLVASWNSRLKGEWSKAIREKAVRDATDSFNPSRIVPFTAQARPREEAMILNEMGLWYVAADMAEVSLEYFAKAATLYGDELDYPYNIVFANHSIGRHQVVLDFIQGAQEDLLKNVNVQLMKAYAQLNLDRPQEALDTFDAYLRMGDATPSWENSADLLRLLRDHCDPERRAAISDRLRSRVGDFNFRLAEADICYDSDPGTARTRFLELGKTVPSNSPAEESYLLALIALEEWPLLQEVCERSLRAGSPSARLHEAHGRARFELDQWSEARISFENALELEPYNEGLLEWLNLVQSRTMRGDSRDLRNRIDPVDLPQDILNTTPAGDLSQYASRGAVILQRIEAIEFRPLQRQRTTHFMRVRILNSKGLEHFASREMEYHPHFEQVWVNRFRLRTSHGEEKDVDISPDLYTRDENRSGLHSFEKTLVIPLHGLEIDCEFELVVTKESKYPDETFPFTSRTLYDRLPVLRSELIIKGDTASVQYVTNRPDLIRTEPGLLHFGMEHPPYGELPDHAPEPWDILPVIHLLQVGPDWKALGEGHLNDMASLMSTDSHAEELAQRICAGLVSEDDKIRAVVNYVRKNFRYNGIEFGRRGRIPAPVRDSLAKRYGDCKDHSLVLLHLLRAIGVESSLALVSTSDRVSSELPSLDQFDHMILHCPRHLPATFIDATIKSAPSWALPLHLEGRTALVLQSGNSRLMEIPKRSLEKRIVLERRLHPMPGGRIDVEEMARFEGYAGVMMRRYFLQSNVVSFPSVLSYLFDHPTSMLKIHHLEIDHLEDNDLPLICRLRYASTRGVETSGRGTRMAVPHLFEKFFLQTRPDDEQRFPFEIDYPIHLESRTTLPFADGGKLKWECPDNLQFEGAVSKARLDWKVEDGQLILDFSYRENPGMFPVGAYDDFRRVSVSAIEAVGIDLQSP